MTANDKKIGRNIVGSRFDTVINPSLHGLSAERKLLSKRNWTWRFEQQGLLSIAHVESSIAFEALDNLDQFLNLGPSGAKESRPKIDLHDESADRLTKGCRTFHNAVKDSPELATIYESAKRDEALFRQPGQGFDSLFGAYPPARHLDVLAEDIVNGAGLLPNYYTTAPLWNKYRDEFLNIREASGIRSHWEDCNQTGANLEQTVDQLITLLKLVRQDLSLEYDLPLVQASLA